MASVIGRLGDRYVLRLELPKTDFVVDIHIVNTACRDGPGWMFVAHCPIHCQGDRFSRHTSDIGVGFLVVRVLFVCHSSGPYPWVPCQ